MSDRPGDPDSADRVQLIGVKQDLGFDGLGRLALVPETVRTDAVFDGSDPLCSPAFGLQPMPGKRSGAHVVRGTAFGLTGLGWVLVLHIMQQRGCMYDLQVSMLSLSEVFNQVVDAQDMVPSVNRVVSGIPALGVGYGWQAGSFTVSTA